MAIKIKRKKYKTVISIVMTWVQFPLKPEIIYG